MLLSLDNVLELLNQEWRFDLSGLSHQSFLIVRLCSMTMCDKDYEKCNGCDAAIIYLDTLLLIGYFILQKIPPALCREKVTLEQGSSKVTTLHLHLQSILSLPDKQIGKTSGEN